MRDNPAIQTYNNIRLDEMSEPKKPTLSGLLAPRKTMKEKAEDRSNEPLSRVVAHMSSIRRKRNEINDGTK